MDRRKRADKNTAKARRVGALSRKPLPSGPKFGTRAVVLIGFMGAGKSSVGRALADLLGWKFEDLDERIERRELRKVHEIFRKLGESEFRRAEHEALRELMGELRKGAAKVVALGGGAFVQERNAALIASAAPTVFLDASVEELWRRCQLQAEQVGLERPLMKAWESFGELYDQRRPHYLKASLRQETEGKMVKEIAEEVMQALGLEPGLGSLGDKK